MSNKIVPSIYRTVIDDVIASIKPEFEEYGVSEDVLAELQHKWEDKVIASRVAEFEPPNPTPQFSHAIQMPQYASVHAYVPPPPPQQSQIKSEPVDSRYVLNTASYTLPPLLGPKLNGRPNPGGQTSVLSFPPGPPQGRPSTIPQVDGPSEDSDDSATPPPATYAPRASHPSLPQPQASSSTAPADSEAINSDLDDSDTEDEDLEDGGGANSEIVFCTYEKVTRVKSKWKCVLKDGMIHANGKDYLFSRCTGEFEFDWV
ncbi:transcription factor IIA alpha/beta subunit [Mycena belliarum]|uniref:Transcription factor IIA alpha/beta subunit n=1 Tax=Mycena belliarum TaxID=1033014 RepID=A0AAD6XLW5_9AGAR|nr:transcription factor IIA alpha/beta subunit [Mycena belliae]